MSDAAPAPRKPWYKTIQAWCLIVIALVLVGVLATCIGGGGSSEPSAENTPSPSPSETIVVSQSPAPPSVEPAPSTQEPVEVTQPSDLAARVEANLLFNLGIDSFPDYLTREGADPTRLWGYIASIEDVTGGVVQVYIQTTGADTTDEQARELAIGVMNLAGSEYDDLEYVIVQTADGTVTEQVSRADSPVLG